MGLFNKSNKYVQGKSGTTVIAKGTCLAGGISTDETIQIDGKFEGVIIEANVVLIGVSGEVVGDMKANNIIISGFFDGKIDCNEVHITKTGRVIGEIKYDDLIIEPEGKFEGNGIRKGSTIKSNYKTVGNSIDNIVKNPKIIDTTKNFKEI